MIASRALVTDSFARTILDVSEDELVELVEEGLVFPTWNISRPGAKARELRFHASGLQYYCSLRRPMPADPKEICADIFPPGETCTTVTLRRSLNCSAELVRQLVLSKQLTLAPGERMRRGPGGCAKVTRNSAIAFLEKRLL